MATAKEVCKGVPRSYLDRVVSDIHVAQLAKIMNEWQELAPFLDLTPTEEEEIIERYRGRLQLQKREALRKWKERNGRKATYQKLIEIFCDEERVDLAETLKHLLTSENRSGSASQSDVIDVFHDYLHDCYSDLPHPSSQQWPLNSYKCYIEPELFDVPLKSGESKPISLQSLFAAGNSKAKRKVILIEGIAGVGKTTLSWHACKEWAAGNLFKDIKLLIHVSLNDATLHTASKLADLIPHPSEDLRASIAKAVADKRGKGICFLLEGCDEAPQSLWQSFLSRFVAGTGGRSMLPDAHIILTSRPGIPIQVAESLSGKVIMRGFNLLDYLYSVEDSAQLLEVLEMKPELYSLCHLPLNAVILVYLYHNFKCELPTTRTGLFGLFVRNFLIRHMQTRANYEPTSINDFPADLPSDIYSSLRKISALAYNSLLVRKVIIDQQMFQEFGDDNAFGFLQVHQMLTMCGPNKQFMFIHLSLQEFLAAFHVSQMDKHQQITAFKSVFGQNPLSPVLTFYAGLTGLRIGEVQDILLKVLSKPIDTEDIVKGLGLTDPYSIHTVNPAHDLRRHMLALMNCMYETQNVSLLAGVKLPVCKLQSNYYFGLNELVMCVSIPLLGMLLYPTDCLAIGYFLTYAGDKKCWVVFRVDFSYCLLGEMEFKALATELQKTAQIHKNYVTINLIGVYISSKAIDSLAALISTDSCVLGLDVICDLLEDEPLFLKNCIEEISKRNSITTELGLQSTYSYLIYYLILLLRCQCLTILGLSRNYLLFSNHSATLLFLEALKYSHLKALALYECGIDDDSLKLIMAAVCRRGCTIENLNLDSNPYSEHGLSSSLKLLLNSPFVRLRKLSVNCVSHDHNKLQKSINDIREFHCQPRLMIMEYTLKSKEEEMISNTAILNYYTFMRPDLAFQSLHH